MSRMSLKTSGGKLICGCSVVIARRPALVRRPLRGLFPHHGKLVEREVGRFTRELIGILLGDLAETRRRRHGARAAERDGRRGPHAPARVAQERRHPPPPAPPPPPPPRHHRPPPRAAG